VPRQEWICSWRPGALVALATLAGCQLPLDHAPCPCSEGRLCCAYNQVCVAEAGECPAPTTYANPVFVGPLSNPTIIREGETYYAYSDGFDLHRIRIMSSPDLVSWRGLGGAFSASAVAWADASTGSNFTSPSVVRFDGNPEDQRFVLYFTAMHAGTGEPCIGVASAGDPQGPFIAAAEPLICPSGGGQDPSLVAGSETFGYPQLLYRENGPVPGLYNRVLNPDGLSIRSGLGPGLLLEAHPGWWHQGIVERPTIATGVGGTYLFFAGTPAGGIDRAIGWSPCVVRLGVVITCSRQTYLGTWMAGDSSVASVGGPQVFKDGENWWMVYDGRQPRSCSGDSCSGPATLRIDKLCFEHGLPRTNGPSSGPQIIRRHVDCSADVPGEPLIVESIADELVVPQPATVTARDRGHTAPVQGRLLWSFSDTDINACPPCGIDNGTAALGVPAPATTNAAWTEEPLDANGFPLPFIPYTAHDVAPGEGYFRIQVGGMQPVPDRPVDGPLDRGRDALVVFLRSVPGAGSDGHSIGLARVHSGATQVDRDARVSPLACNPTCLFDSSIVADRVQGGVYDRPFVHDEYLYLSGSGKLARAPLDDIDTRSAWRFWNSIEWVADFTQATAVPNLHGTLSYNAYLDQYVALGEGAWPNLHHLVISTAPSPSGPWSPPQTLHVADHGCPTKETAARAWVDHPWLAMNGGRTFAVSYFRPGDYGTSCPSQVRLTYINLARAQ
jgi:hypothetical protein